MDDARTVFCGNISEKVTEEILYELFLQVAPLERVKIPTDKEGRKSNFAFITFKHEVSVNYAQQVLNGIKLYDKTLNIKPRNVNKTSETMPRPWLVPQQHQNNFQHRPSDNRDNNQRDGRDNYNRDDRQRSNFRDNYRDDRFRDNSHNWRNDRNGQHDNSKRRNQNFDRRGSFNNRNNRHRDRHY